MIKNIFKKEKKIEVNNNVLIAALLIHAAKIDENYTDEEKKIVTRSVADLFNISSEEAEKLVKDAEKKRTRIKSNS